MATVRSSPLAGPAMDLSGRTALVTGAASGIGRACAQRLAAAGARVVLVDINADGLDAVAGAVGGVPCTLDLADLDAIDRLDADVDILVNNAGLQHVAAIEDFPPAVFSRILLVMLEAPFRLVRHVLPHMYAGGWGRVINISSVHGLRASPYKAAYVAAKHGLEGLSKVIALEGGARGVTSNCLNPAYVRTPLVENQIAAQAAAHALDPSAVLDNVMLARPAIKRLIEADEVAEFAAYLCTPQASFVTGASIAIDGGWTAQ